MIDRRSIQSIDHWTSHSLNNTSMDTKHFIVKLSDGREFKLVVRQEGEADAPFTARVGVADGPENALDTLYEQFVGTRLEAEGEAIKRLSAWLER